MVRRSVNDRTHWADGSPRHPDTRHSTPRMSNLPDDPAYGLLWDGHQSTPRVKRDRCYICRDQEFARMGLPLCSPCCECRKSGKDGHIPADDTECDDCGHEACAECANLPAQAEPICTCDSPCCEVDVGIGLVNCGAYHCPTHGERAATSSDPSKETT